MSFVEVVRGAWVESRHRVDVAVADEDGRLVASVGVTDGLTFYRSAAKPMQALPLVEEGVADRIGLTDAELALCCASHEGTPEHVATARSILGKAGVDETLLRCGPHAPFSAKFAQVMHASGDVPGRIHNNCSGKHAGMLALCVGMGWDPVDYHLPEHPVQRRMLDEVVRWSGEARARVATAVDGCGVVCFGVPLAVMAASFARFGAAARDGAPAGRVIGAMTARPFMVGGAGRACTDVMARSEGRVVVKLGAEGVYGGAIPGEGLGLAIKVVDGGRRAVEVALVHVLAELGALRPGEVAALRRYGRPDVVNTRGERVGEIRPAFTLEGAGRDAAAARATPTILER
ncbi:MAG: asparaginase [Gemmatimonadota bacterium]